MCDDPLPPPLPYGKHGRRPVRCQHCDRDIEQLTSGPWVDSDGISICMKTAAELPFTTGTEYVFHTPMPVI